MGKKVQTVSFKTDMETYKIIQSIAATEDRSTSYIIDRLLRAGIREYKSMYEDENKRALKVMQYIESLTFESYGEFLKIAISEGKYDWISECLGKMQAYFVVCDILGIEPDLTQVNQFDEDIEN